MDMRRSSRDRSGHRHPRRGLATLVAAIVVATTLAGTPAGADEQGRLLAFGDVAARTFYERPVAWMAAEGITTGIEPGCFGPDLPVTRAQVATFLYRLERARGGNPIAPLDELPFTDVTADWARTPVAWMAAEGITTGRAPGVFAPDAPVTRGEFAAFVWRYAGRPDPPDADAAPFDDVERPWQRTAVAWMAAEGITTGRAPGVFAPDAPVTRAEAATFLWRLVGRPATTTAAGDPSTCLRPLRETLVTIGLTPAEAACVAPHLAGFDVDDLLVVVETRQVPDPALLDALAAASSCLTVERIHEIVELFF